MSHTVSGITVSSYEFKRIFAEHWFLQLCHRGCESLPVEYAI